METKKKPYEPPLLMVKEVKVEKGFATSDISGGASGSGSGNGFVIGSGNASFPNTGTEHLNSGGDIWSIGSGLASGMEGLNDGGSI